MVPLTFHFPGSRLFGGVSCNQSWQVPRCTNLSRGIWFEGAANSPTAIQILLQISRFLQGVKLSLPDERGLWLYEFDLLQRSFLVDGDTSPRFMTIAAPLRMALTCSRNVVNAVMVVLYGSAALESAARGDQVRLETDMNVATALPALPCSWL